MKFAQKLLLILLTLSSVPSTVLAEVLWSRSLDGFILSLQEEPKDHFHFSVRTEESKRRTISFVTKQKRIAVAFPEDGFESDSFFRIPSNPLVTSLIIKDRSLQLILTESAWKSRRVQETSSLFVVSGHFPKDRFLVDAFASQGRGAPVLKVWDAKIKKRKIVPITRVPVEEEESVKEDDTVIEPELPEAELAEAGLLAAAVANESAENPSLMQTPADDSEIRASFLDSEEESLKLEESPQASELQVESSVQLFFAPKETIVTIGEPLSLEVRNDGLGKIVLSFEVIEEKVGKAMSRATNALTVSPGILELVPGEMKIVNLSFLRPSLDTERVFRVNLLNDLMVSEGATESSKRRLGQVKFFIQPEGGVARVAWTRDEKGITFVNNGNISSKFVDVKICKGKCTKVDDIYLSPYQERFFSISAAAEMKLTQIAGENQRTGTIPRFER